MSFDPAGKSVDQILDYGAPGLQYWEHFLPLYTKVFGAPEGLGHADLYARYDEQRGADLIEFDTARTELDRVLTDAESRWSSHQAVAQTLPTAWTGATGTEALTIVNSQLRQARDDLDTIRTASTTIAAALDPLRESVLTKAEHTLALLEPTPDGEGRLAIDGKTPDDIEALDPIDPWLTGTFRADVDHKLAAFTAACATTNETFESHYRTIITALAQVIDHPYPQPAQALLPEPEESPAPSIPTPQPLPAPQSYPAATPPTSHPQLPQPVVPPGYPPPSGGATTSDPTQPQSPDRAQPTAVPPESLPGRAGSNAPAAETQPAGVADPGGAESGGALGSTDAGTGAFPEQAQPRSGQFSRTLKDALSQLETGLQQGISAAVEKLGSLAGQTSPSPGESEAANEPKPDTDHPEGQALPRDRLEFDLAEKHFVLDRTPSGDLILTATDESGRTHTYTLSFDQNGIPVLATDDPAHTPTAPTGDANTTPDPPATGSGGGTPGTPKNTQPIDPSEVGPTPDQPLHPNCVPRTCTVPDPPIAPPNPCPDHTPDQAAPPEVPAPPHAAEDDVLPDCTQPSTPDCTPDQAAGGCVPSTSPAPTDPPPVPAHPLDNPVPSTATGQPGSDAPLTAATPWSAEPGAPMEIPEEGLEIPETTEPLAP
ncbi:hypothetical protein [Nocardia sp. NPDC046763]|uniref:hypothetical protein n=1 Tax=Nocardia sp. NPDC046763 TaxID=3155256 RepID=UPI0033D905FF